MLTGRGFCGLGLIKGDRHEEGELMTPYKQCAPSLAAAAGVATEHSVMTGPTGHTADLGLGGTAPAGSLCVDACQDVLEHGPNGEDVGGQFGPLGW